MKTTKVESREPRAESQNKLHSEAERYNLLAKNIALDLLLNPFIPDAEKKKQLAREHALRAETYRTAATLIG